MEKIIEGMFTDCYILENLLFLRDAENTFHLFQEYELKTKKRFPLEFSGEAIFWGKLMALSPHYRFALIYNWENQESLVVDFGLYFLRGMKFYESDHTISLAIIVEEKVGIIKLLTWNFLEKSITSTNLPASTLNSIPCLFSATSRLYLASSSGYIDEVDLLSKSVQSTDISKIVRPLKEAAMIWIDEKIIAVGRADGSILVCDQDQNVLESYPEGSFAHHFIYHAGKILTDNSVISKERFSAKAELKNCTLPTTEYMCYLQNKAGSLSVFYHGIPYSLIMKSDKLFRGCNGIFVLKQYGSDIFPTMILASFAKSSSLFSLDYESGTLTDISENFPLPLESKTLLAKNSPVGSWFIQICPYSLSILRSVIRDIPSEEIFTLRIEELYGALVAAVVEREYIFSISESHHLLIFQVLVGKGGKSISLRHSIILNFHATGPIAVLPTRAGVEEYIIAVAGSSTNNLDFIVKFLLFDVGKNSVREEWSHALGQDPVNDLKLSEQVKNAPVILIGTKTGILKINDIRDERRVIISQKIGSRPVNLLQISSQFLASSDDVKLVSEHSDYPKLLNFAPRADFMCLFSEECIGQNAPQIIFLDHESLCVLSSTLSVEPWINMLIKIPDLHLLGVIEDNAVIAIGSLLQIVSNNGDIISSLELPLIETINAFKPMAGSYYSISGSVNDKCGRVLVLEIQESPKRKSFRTQYSLTIVGSAGFPDQINDFDYIGSLDAVSFNIAVAAGKDLHIVKFTHSIEGLQFVYTNTWRLQIHSLNFGRLSGLLAIADLRSIQIIDLPPNTLEWKRKYMMCTEAKRGSIFWSDELLIVTTKTGNLLSINPNERSIKSLGKNVFKVFDTCAFKKSLLGLTLEGNVIEYYPPE